MIAISMMLLLSKKGQHPRRGMVAPMGLKVSKITQRQLLPPRFYVSTSKSIIKALINMHSFEIQLSPIG
ncbi:hypothetical protein BJQ62_30010 [Klebsiella pneumoniae]|nr:hypothetical protein [Klebsiella pneumoniae]EIW8833821.1 hypothetical protein [Klebsiella pneumoniae]